MLKFFSIIAIVFIILQIPLPLMACDSGIRIVKKPEALRFENPDPSHPYLTTQDRLMWKSVLNWCDECDERAKPFTESDDGQYGGIFVIAMGPNRYLVDIQCRMTMHSCEHIYYKVIKNAAIIESRLLVLEQYLFNPAKGSITDGIEEPDNDPEGEFIRFTDSISYGLTDISDKTEQLLILERRYRAMGGCGLYTVYDVSGDCPKVIEFRAKLFCSPESPGPEKWKLYPARQRARWRVVPNPQRKDWKTSATPACSK